MGTLVLETITKIRPAYLQDEKSIKQICRKLRVSQGTVRRVLRSGANTARAVSVFQELHRELLRAGIAGGRDAVARPVLAGPPLSSGL